MVTSGRRSNKSLYLRDFNKKKIFDFGIHFIVCVFISFVSVSRRRADASVV